MWRGLISLPIQYLESCAEYLDNIVVEWLDWLRLGHRDGKLRRWEKTHLRRVPDWWRTS